MGRVRSIDRELCIELEFDRTRNKNRGRADSAFRSALQRPKTLAIQLRQEYLPQAIGIAVFRLAYLPWAVANRR